MPLIKSSSKPAFKQNVKTLMGEIGESPHVQSRDQALAVAYSIKRRSRKGYADGGTPTLDDKTSAIGIHPVTEEDVAQQRWIDEKAAKDQEVRSWSDTWPARLARGIGSLITAPPQESPTAYAPYGTTSPAEDVERAPTPLDKTVPPLVTGAGEAIYSGATGAADALSGRIGTGRNEPL